jgi:hypothetical protein
LLPVCSKNLQGTASLIPVEKHGKLNKGKLENWKKEN